MRRLSVSRYLPLLATSLAVSLNSACKGDKGKDNPHRGEPSGVPAGVTSLCEQMRTQQFDLDAVFAPSYFEEIEGLGVSKEDYVGVITGLLKTLGSCTGAE